MDDKTCKWCKGCCEGFKVEILDSEGTPLSSVEVGQEFNLKVTATNADAKGVVTATGSGTLTLNDASRFPSSGKGYIKSGCSRSGPFTWTGKSGNQLTGVAGDDLPSAGDSVELVVDKDTVDGSCNSTAVIIATVNGEDGDTTPPTVTLSATSITLVSGVKEISLAVVKTSFENNREITITVREKICPGRCGSKKLTTLIPPVIECRGVCGITFWWNCDAWQCSGWVTPGATDAFKFCWSDDPNYYCCYSGGGASPLSTYGGLNTPPPDAGWVRYPTSGYPPPDGAENWVYAYYTVYGTAECVENEYFTEDCNDVCALLWASSQPSGPPPFSCPNWCEGACCVGSTCYNVNKYMCDNVYSGNYLGAGIPCEDPNPCE